MSIKARLLRNLKVTRIDLVDRGAALDKETGEGAHILLYKRDGDVDVSKTPMKCPKCDEPLMMKYSDGGLSLPNYCPECGAGLELKASGGNAAEKRAPAKQDKGVTMKVDLSKLDDKTRPLFDALVSKVGDAEGADAALGAIVAEVIKSAEALAAITTERDAAVAKAAEVEKAAKPADEFEGVSKALKDRILADREKIAKLEDERDLVQFEKDRKSVV